MADSSRRFFRGAAQRAATAAHFSQSDGRRRWHASCSLLRQQAGAHHGAPACVQRKGSLMWLLAYYVAFMIAGDFSAYFIGLFVEYEFGSQASLIVFLALYFLFLWVSWVLAVWVTKPREAEGLAG
jgi:hypothetical protein